VNVAPLVPDAAASAPTVVAPPSPPGGGGAAFARLLDAAGSVLSAADAAEHAFANHRGGLAEMVVERARADIALHVAAATAQRAAQGVQTLLGMQI
jgi:hypothetical protein